MSSASKQEETRLTPTIRLALLLDGSAVRASYCCFYCSFSYWCLYSNNEASVNVVNVVKSRRDYVVWKKGIHAILCCKSPIKYDHLETEKKN